MKGKMNKLRKILEDVLTKEPSFLDIESEELDYIKIKDSADKLDSKLISLISDNRDLKEKFFIKIKDVYVFNSNDFKFFLDENKLDNSYTNYSNRIGLSDGLQLLKYNDDVVLDFPFKDCVLEGGQSTEEGSDTYYEYEEEKTKTIKGEKIVEPDGYKEKQSKRDEIFFNQTLAHDEIDRLLERKALINWKRFSKKSDKNGDVINEIYRDENGLIRENLIIKGNNLIALHTIKSEFAGKIKLIYIDPPYNTPGDGNTFSYNNTFNHSTWLTFMKNRIEISYELLKDDGLIAIAIDDVEQAYLAILCDEVFGRENRIGTLIVQSKPGGRTNDSYFATSHEYVLFYAKNANAPKINFFELTDKQKKKYSEGDGDNSYKWRDFLRTGGYSTPKERPNSYYPIYFDKASNEITLQKKNGFIEIFPLDSKDNKRVWRKTKPSFQKHLKDNEIKVEKNRDGKWKVKIIDKIKSGIRPGSVWVDSKYDASAHGTKELKKIFNGEKVFSYPKSIHAVQDVLEIFTDEGGDDIILDFFGGSATTAHAVTALNEKDEGARQYIIVEQMDYAENVTAKRVHKILKITNSNNSFIYLELAKWNEQAKEEINNARSLEELFKLFDNLYERYFLNYNVKTKEFKEKVVKEENFKKLTLTEQKSIFLSMLDLNQMYVQASEMSDKRYKINEQDQKLTRSFYNEE